MATTPNTVLTSNQGNQMKLTQEPTPAKSLFASYSHERGAVEARQVLAIMNDPRLQACQGLGVVMFGSAREEPTSIHSDFHRDTARLLMTTLFRGVQRNPKLQHLVPLFFTGGGPAVMTHGLEGAYLAAEDTGFLHAPTSIGLRLYVATEGDGAPSNFEHHGHLCAYLTPRMLGFLHYARFGAICVLGGGGTAAEKVATAVEMQVKVGSPRPLCVIEEHHQLFLHWVREFIVGKGLAGENFLKLFIPVQADAKSIVTAIFRFWQEFLATNSAYVSAEEHDAFLLADPLSDGVVDRILANWETVMAQFIMEEAQGRICWNVDATPHEQLMEVS
jgi:predicted Rossmann-fold nucleotide-binding protein